MASGKAFRNKRKARRVSIESETIARTVGFWLVSMSFDEPFIKTKSISVCETGAGDSGVGSFGNVGGALPAALSDQSLQKG